MEKLKSMGEYDKNAGITVVIGRKKALPKGVPKENLVLIGQCLIKFKDRGLFVGGCPPGEPAPAWTIIDRKGTVGPEDLDFNIRERMESEDKVFRDYMHKIAEKNREESKK